MASGKARGPVKAVQIPSPEACVPGAEAAEEAWSSLQYGEAGRIGVIGDTGAGKSTAMRALIREYMKRSPGLVVVIDDKGPRQRFEGQARRDIADLRKNPMDPKGPRVVVLRGDCFAGYKVDREEVADYSWKIVGRHQPCLVVNDELKEAAAGGQWKSGSLWLPRSFSQGREVGLSQLWGTQDTQEVPPEAFNQTRVIFCFKIAGNGLRLLGQRNYTIGEGVEEALPALPGEDDPPALRGAHVMLRRGKPWNGKFYRHTVD